MDYKKEEEDDVRIAADLGRGNHLSFMCSLSLSLQSVFFTTYSVVSNLSDENGTGLEGDEQMKDTIDLIHLWRVWQLQFRNNCLEIVFVQVNRIYD